MSVVVYDCQRQVEEDEDDEGVMPRMVHNIQVAKRRLFTLYECIDSSHIWRPVVTLHIMAWSLCRAFRERVAVVQYCSVPQFIKRHGLVHQMGMHISQWGPRELQSSRIHGNGLSDGYLSRQGIWLHHQYGLVSHSIHFRQAENFRIGKHGYCPYLQLTCDDKWATLALTITAFFGKMLTPILVSKVMP